MYKYFRYLEGFRELQRQSAKGGVFKNSGSTQKVVFQALVMHNTV
jgi:hypothetical protein